MAFFNNKRRDFSIQPPRQQVDSTPFFVTDSANIDFTLENLNLTANLTQLLPTSGTYGNATNIPVLQIDQYGRITGVTTVAIGGGGGTYTVDNGLTASTLTNFQLGGATLGSGDLIRDTYITNNGYTFRIDQTGASTNALYLSHLGITPNAGTGLRVEVADGRSIRATSTGGIAFEGVTQLDYTQQLIRNATSNNDIVGLLRLDRGTSGVPFGGIGGSIDFWIEERQTIPVPIPTDPTVRLAGLWENPGPAVLSRLSRFDIYGYSSGGALLNASVRGDGKFVLHQYGVNTFAGTPTYSLGVDASGNVVEFTGGGGGTVTSVTATSPITSSGGATPDISTSMATNKLIGRGTAGTGVMEEITLGTGLSLSGTTLNVTTTSGGILHGTASGTDTYTVTITGATAYADGDAYLIRFTNGNTTSATLNINAQGAVPLYRNNDGALIGGDIVAGGEMLCVYNSTTNRFQVIGTAPNTLLSYVTNDDSVTLTKGMVVYAFGGVGDRMTVKRASNLGDATSAQTVGLVLSTSIAANQKGLIMMQGLLDGLNILPTSTWNDGDAVYLGDTAGTITKIKPYAPKHLVYLGVVTTASNGSAGRMYVRVQNGYELDELHNVQAQSPSLNDTLYYDNTVSPAQWKTTSVNTLLNTSIKTGSCGVTFDASLQVLQPKTAYVQIPYNGTLTSWSIVADQLGACTIAVSKGTFGAFPTSSAVYVTNPAIPATNQTATNPTPTYNVGMSTVTAGDVLKFEISAITAITWVNFSISITKT